MNTIASQYEHDHLQEHAEAVTKMLLTSMRYVKLATVAPWGVLWRVLRMLGEVNDLAADIKRLAANDCSTCAKNGRCLRPLVPDLYRVADELDGIADSLPVWNLPLLPLRLHIKKTSHRLATVAEDAEDIIDAANAMNEEGERTPWDKIKAENGL